MPFLSRFDAVILDLDGTMVDTLDDFVAALQGMLADLNLPSTLERAAIASMVGKGSEHLIRSALQHVLRASLGSPLSEQELEMKVEQLQAPAWLAYQAHYRRINGMHAAVFPGVNAGLAHMRQQGLPMACLTNKPVAFARELLERKGLLENFAHVFGGDSFSRKKPDPLPLLKTCDALGTLPERTLMVGDSVNDAQAAHAAGCAVVLVSYGYNHGKPIRKVAADGHIDSLAELL